MKAEWFSRLISIFYALFGLTFLATTALVWMGAIITTFLGSEATIKED